MWRLRFGPQIVGEAACVALAVLAPAAPGGVHRPVHGHDHVGDGHPRRRLAQPIAAAPAAGAGDEPRLAQAGEELLEERERDPLAVCDVGERHGAISIVESEIEHGRDRVSTPGVESHVVRGDESGGPAKSHIPAAQSSEGPEGASCGKGARSPGAKRRVRAAG